MRFPSFFVVAGVSEAHCRHAFPSFSVVVGASEAHCRHASPSFSVVVGAAHFRHVFPIMFSGGWGPNPEVRLLIEGPCPWFGLGLLSQGPNRWFKWSECELRVRIEMLIEGRFWVLVEGLKLWL
jgi:hypothetical protein